MPTPSSTEAETLQQLKRCLHILDDKKAADIQVIVVGDISTTTDYVVLATATSEPHLRALRGEFLKLFKDASIPVMGIEYSDGSGWIVIDAFDFMLHVFLPDVREAYQLDGLWKTAPHLDVDALLAEDSTRGQSLHKAPAKPRAVKAKAPAKKTAQSPVRAAATKTAPAKKKTSSVRKPMGA